MGPGMQGGNAQIYTTIVVVLIMTVVLWRRNSRPRQLKIERLWIRPVLFALARTLGEAWPSDIAAHRL